MAENQETSEQKNSDNPQPDDNLQNANKTTPSNNQQGWLAWTGGALAAGAQGTAIIVNGVTKAFGDLLYPKETSKPDSDTEQNSTLQPKASPDDKNEDELELEQLEADFQQKLSEPIPAHPLQPLAKNVAQASRDLTKIQPQEKNKDNADKTTKNTDSTANTKGEGLNGLTQSLENNRKKISPEELDELPQPVKFDALQKLWESHIQQAKENSPVSPSQNNPTPELNRSTQNQPETETNNKAANLSSGTDQSSSPQQESLDQSPAEKVGSENINDNNQLEKNPYIGERSKPYQGNVKQKVDEIENNNNSKNAAPSTPPSSTQKQGNVKQKVDEIENNNNSKNKKNKENQSGSTTNQAASGQDTDPKVETSNREPEESPKTKGNQASKGSDSTSLLKTLHDINQPSLNSDPKLESKNVRDNALQHSSKSLLNQKDNQQNTNVTAINKKQTLAELRAALIESRDNNNNPHNINEISKIDETNQSFTLTLPKDPQNNIKKETNLTIKEKDGQFLFQAPKKSLAGNPLDKKQEAMIQKICDLAVASAVSGTKFNTDNTPLHLKEAVGKALENSIKQHAKPEANLTINQPEASANKKLR